VKISLKEMTDIYCAKVFCLVRDHLICVLKIMSPIFLLYLQVFETCIIIQDNLTRQGIIYSFSLRGTWKNIFVERKFCTVLKVFIVLHDTEGWVLTS
jgi:hypothetical protein